MASNYGVLSIGVVADTSALERQVRSASVSAGNKAGQSMGGGISSGIGKAAGVIGKAMGGVVKVGANVLGGATIAAAGFGVAAFKTAARVGEMNATLRALGKANNLSQGSIDKSVRSVKAQGITTGVAQNVVAQMIRSQLDLGKSTDLARVAQDAAVISGRDSSEVLDDLIHGITTQNSLVLRNAGVNVQAGQAVEKYAKAQGRSVKELTNAERANAVLNAVMDEGKRTSGAYASAMKEPGKVLRSFPRLFDEIKLSVGTGLVQAFGPVILKLYEFGKRLTEALEPGGKLRPILDAIAEGAAKLAEPLTKIVERMVDWIGKVKPEQIASIASSIKQFIGPIGAIAGVSAIFTGGGILAKLPIIGGAFQGIGGALGGVGKAAIGAAGPWGALAVAAGALAVASPEARKALAGVAVELGGKFKSALSDAAPSLSNIKDRFLELSKNVGPPLVKILGQIVGLFIELVPIAVDIASKFADVLGPVVSAIAPALDKMGDAFGKVSDNVKGANKDSKSADGAFKSLGGALGFVAGKLAWVSGLNWSFLGTMLDKVKPAFMTLPAMIGRTVEAAKTLGGAFKQLGLDIASNFTRAWSGISGVFSNIWGAVAQTPGKIGGALSGVGNIISAPFRSAWSVVSGLAAQIGGSLRGAPGAIRSAVGSVAGIISSPFRTAWGVVSGVARQIGGALSGVPGSIRGALSSVASIITSPFRNAVSQVAGAARSIGGAMSSVPGAVAGAVSGIVGIITSPFRAAAAIVQGIVNGIKATVGGLAGFVSGAVSAAKAPYNAFVGAFNALPSISIPSVTLPKVGPFGGQTIGGQTIGLPKLRPLARGGVVEPISGGVLALLAEAGRAERVSPLEASGMTSGEEEMVVLLRRVVRLLSAGTTVSIDGQAVASATAAATLYGVSA